MTWLVTSNHLESLHDGRVISPGEDVTGIDSDLDKEIIERGAVVFVGDEPERTATEAALILIADHHLDIADIKGTGKDGRVTEPDVRKVIEQVAATGGHSPASTKDGGHEVAPEPAAAPQKEESK